MEPGGTEFGPLLLVLERARRGVVEVQYSDLLYVTGGLADQIDSVEVALRGDAVALAVASDRPAESLRIGTVEVDSAPDASLRRLLDRGIRVWADDRDMVRLGIASDRVLDGVGITDTDALLGHWPRQKGMWFL